MADAELDPLGSQEEGRERVTFRTLSSCTVRIEQNSRVGGGFGGVRI